MKLVDQQLMILDKQVIFDRDFESKIFLPSLRFDPSLF